MKIGSDRPDASCLDYHGEKNNFNHNPLPIKSTLVPNMTILNNVILSTWNWYVKILVFCRLWYITDTYYNYMTQRCVCCCCYWQTGKMDVAVAQQWTGIATMAMVHQVTVAPQLEPRRHRAIASSLAAQFHLSCSRVSDHSHVTRVQRWPPVRSNKIWLIRLFRSILCV